METRASYILVGAFVLGLIAALIGIGLWVARAQFAATPSRYLIYFTGDVTGLGVGSPARYRGIPVGTVTSIDIDPTDIERVRVVIAVSPDTPIKQDTVAELGFQGITGVAFVQLTGGTQQAPPLKARAKGELPVIRSKPSVLQQVMQRLPEVLERIVTITERATKLFEQDNLDAVKATLQSLRKTMETLSSENGDLRQLLSESRQAVDALRLAAKDAAVLAEKINGHVDPLANSTLHAIGDVEATLKEIRTATTTAEGILTDLNDLVGQSRVPLRDFAQTGLYEFSQFISEARVLVDSLTRLVNRIERDPRNFLFGNSQEGVKAP